MKHRFNYGLVPFFLWILFVVLAQACSPRDRTNETGGTLVAEGIFQEIEYDYDNSDEIAIAYVNSENILRFVSINQRANLKIIEDELEFGCGIRIYQVDDNNYRVSAFEPDDETLTRTQSPFGGGVIASGEFLELELDLVANKVRFFYINSDDMIKWVMMPTKKKIEYSYPVFAPGDHFQLTENDDGYYTYIFPGATGAPDVEPITETEDEPEDEPELVTPPSDEPFIPDRRKQ